MSTVATETQKETTTQNGSPRYERYVAPEVNIYETKDGYVLEAELPGVNKEGLDIQVEDNTLTLIARRVPSDVKGQALYRESTAADYRRAFELDPAIDTAKIEATLNQGVLTLTLPKSEAVKPRKIAVNG